MMIARDIWLLLDVKPHYCYVPRTSIQYIYICTLCASGYRFFFQFLIHFQ